MSKALLPALFAAALSLWAADATAQTPGRLSVDLGIGRGLGTGDGWYMDNGKGITGDVLVSYRLRDLGSGGLLVGANAGIQGTSAYATICTIGPEEGCLAPFPPVRHLRSRGGLGELGREPARLRRAGAGTCGCDGSRRLRSR